MGGSTGGYKRAREAIETGLGEQRQIAGEAEQPYAPYQQAGAGGLEAYQQALSQGQDPSQLYSQLLEGYQESPYLQPQLEYGEQAAQRAASASGMLGSGAEQQAAAGRAQALRGQDVQNYLNQVLGLRQQYLGGQAGLGGLGLQAAGGVSGARQQYGQQVGQGYGGIAQSYLGEAQQPTFGEQMLGAVGQIGGAAMPFMLGGPVGGAAALAARGAAGR